MVDRWEWAQGRDQLPWWQQRLLAPGDALGAIGTVRDIAVDEATRPALGAITAGAVGAENFLDAMRGRQAQQAMPQAFTREALAEYQRQKWQQSGPVMEAIGETLVDPLSYVGSPAAKGATALARVLPFAATPLTMVAGANQAYERGVDKVIRGTGQLAARAIRTTEAGRNLLDLAPGGKVAKLSDELAGAMRDLDTSMRDAVRSRMEFSINTPYAPYKKMGLKANEQMAKTLEGFEKEIVAISNPMHKLVALELFREARNMKDQIMKRTADIAHSSLTDESVLDPRVRAKISNDMWATGFNQVAGLLEGLDAGLKNLASTPERWAKVQAQFDANPAMYQPIIDELDRTLATNKRLVERASREADELRLKDEDIRDLAHGLPGLPPKVKRALDKGFGFDVLNPTMRASSPLDEGQIRGVLQQARDEKFRGVNRVTDRLLQRQQRRHGATLDAIDPEARAAAFGDARQEMERVFGDLDNATRSWEELMPGIAEGSAKTLSEQRHNINRALASINSTRKGIEKIVAPYLRPEDYTDGTLQSSRKLVQAMKDRIPPGMPDNTLAELENRLKTYSNVADPLNPAHNYRIVQRKIIDRYAQDLGIKNVPNWWTNSVQLWKELALLAPAYHFANTATGYFFSSKLGIDPETITRGLIANTKVNGEAIKQAILRGEIGDIQYDADTFSVLRDLRGDPPSGLMPSPIQRQTGVAAELGAAGPERRSAWGRLNPVVAGGIGAAAGATGAAMAGEEEGDILKAGAIGAGVGGVALPRLTALNRVMAGIIESAMRGTAVHHKVQSLLPEATAGFTAQLRAQARTPGVTMTPTAAAPDMYDELAEWIEANAGRVSVDRMRRYAIETIGFAPDEAARVSGQWNTVINDLEEQGVRLSNSIHFDYEDVPNVTDWLRRTGVMPFLTWQTKAAPLMATILLQNPYFLVAISEYNQATERDIAEANLPKSLNGRVSTGLGNHIVESIFGRPGEVYSNPFAPLIPMMDVFGQATGADRPVYGDSPQDRLLEQAQRLGLGVSPFIRFPLETVGALDESQGNLVRQSGLIEAGTGVNPEAAVREGSRRFARAMGADRDEVMTSSAATDYRVRQRIVEMSGGEPTGEYLRAMDDPEHPIFKEALASVRRTNLPQQLIGQSVPVQPRFVSQEEREYRGAAMAAGVDPESIRLLRSAPTRTDEMLIAMREFQRKNGRSGTTEELEELVRDMRVSSQYKRAEQMDPRATALSNLGSDRRSRDNRAWDKYRAFQAQIKRVKNSKRKAQLTQQFYEQNPDVKKVIERYRATLY